MKRLLRPYIFEVLLFFVIIGFSFLVLVPVSNSVTKRLIVSRDAIVENIQQQTGFLLSFESLSPSIFRFIYFKNLQISDAETNKVIAQFSKVVIEYDFFSLLRGESVSAISAIRLQDGDIFIELENLVRYQSKLSLVFNNKNTTSNVFSDPLDQNLEVLLKNIRFEISDISKNISMTLTSGKAQIEQDIIHFEINSRANYNQFSPLKINDLQATAVLRGSIDIASASASASIIVSRIESSFFQLNRIVFLASYRDFLLSVSTVQELEPIDITFSYNVKKYEYTASFICENLLPIKWLALNKKNTLLEPFSTLTFSGNAYIQGSLESIDKYHGSFDVRLPKNINKGAIIKAEISGDNTKILFEKIHVQGSNVDIESKGSYFIKDMSYEGYVLLNKLYHPSGFSVTGDFFFEPVISGLHCIVPVLTINEAQFTTIDFAINYQSESSSFLLTAFDPSGEIEISGTQSSGNSLFTEVYAAFDSLSIVNFLNIINGTSLLSYEFFPDTFLQSSENYKLTTELYLSTDFSNISFNSPRLVIASTEADGFFVLLSATGTDSAIEINNIDFSGLGYSITGSISSIFDPQRDVLFDSSIFVNSIPYNFSGIFSQQNLSVYGDYGLAASISLFDTKGFFGSLRFTNLPIPIGTAIVSVSLVSSIEAISFLQWQVKIEESFFEENTGLTPLSTILSLRGSIDQNGFLFDNVTMEDSYSRLEGSWLLSKLSINDYSTTTIYSSELSLASISTNENYVIKGRITQSSDVYFDIQGDFVDFPLMRATPGQGLTHLVSTSLKCSGTKETFMASVTIQRLLYRIAGFDLEAKGMAVFDDSVLNIYDATASWNGSNLIDINGNLNVQSRNGLFSAMFTRILGQSSLDMNLNVDFHALSNDPVFSLSDLPTFFDESSATLSINDVTWNTYQSTDTISISVVRETEITQFFLGSQKIIEGFILDNGTFSFFADTTSPVRFIANGNIQNSQIEATIDRIFIDLQQIDILKQIGLVQFFEGKIEGGVSIVGLVNDPDISGTLDAQGVVFSSPSFFDQKVGPVNFSLFAEGNTIEVPEFTAKADEGAVTISASATLERWVPSSFTIHSATLEGQPFKISTKNEFMAASGYINYDLSFLLENSEILIDGDVSFERGYIASFISNLAQQQAVLADNFLPIICNFKFSVGKKVEFRWPSDEFPVLSALVQAQEPFDILVDTQQGTFLVRGQATLRGGEIFYIKRSFYLRQGIITFNETQESFDPYITVRAEIRERDANGDPIRIVLQVDNQPLSSFMPRLYAEPPLTEAEIMEILGQVVSGDTKTETFLRDTVINASDVLTQLSLFRNVENNIRDILHLDLFSIRTLVIQNAVLGNSTQNTSNEPLTIGNYFDNTTVYLGKYFGSSIYSDALLHFNYFDPVKDKERVKGNIVFGNLLFQPEIGMEVATPFFLLRWNFAPSRLDTLFVSDNSVTLSWKFSY